MHSASRFAGYTVNSATVSGDVLYIAGQPRYNHTGQVVIYRMEDGDIRILQTLHGEQTRFEYQMSLEPMKQTCCSSLKHNSCTKENKNEPCGARFGTAISAVKDLNLDGFNDIVIGAPLEDDHGGAVYIYHGSGKTIREESRDVAVVKVTMNFEPNKVNIQKKNCRMEGKETVCINATVCFDVKLKSKEDRVYEADMQYRITLDSLRQISRSFFSGTQERKIQRNITVRESECTKHSFYMLDKHDFRDSVRITLDFNLTDPENGPVLDDSLPNSVHEYIPFAKDCGNKEKCISDLVLDVSTTEKGQLIVRSHNDKFNVSLTVKNKEDSAYNTRTIVNYSPNLIFSGIEAIQKDSCESNRNITCKVGYPFLRRGEM
ncbi:Integrin alpha-1, partial [Eschrichtius robustus]|nr:Integrin alpha-1 [Eschrichtius robustus]